MFDLGILVEWDFTNESFEDLNAYKESLMRANGLRWVTNSLESGILISQSNVAEAEKRINHKGY